MEAGCLKSWQMKYVWPQFSYFTWRKGVYWAASPIWSVSYSLQLMAFFHQVSCSLQVEPGECLSCIKKSSHLSCMTLSQGQQDLQTQMSPFLRIWQGMGITLRPLSGYNFVSFIVGSAESELLLSYLHIYPSMENVEYG